MGHGLALVAPQAIWPNCLFDVPYDNQSLKNRRLVL